MDGEKTTYTWKQKFAALGHHLKPYRKELIALSLLGIIAAIFNGVVPYITGRFLDALIKPSTTHIAFLGTVSLWLLLLMVWFLLQLVSNVTSWISDRRQRLLTTKLEGGTLAKAYRHLLTVKLAFFKHTRMGEITNDVNRTSWMLSSLTNILTSLGSQFLTIIVGIVISFFMLPQLAAVLLIGIALYSVVLGKILPQTSEVQIKGWDTWRKVAGDAQDAYENFQTVKQATAESFEQKRIQDGFFTQAIPFWFRLERLWSNLGLWQRIIVLFTQTAIFALSVYFIAHGKITVGDLVAFNTYAGMIIGPFVSLGMQWQTLQNGFVAVTRSERVFNAESEIYEPEHALTLSPMEGRVVFHDVHFTYEKDQPEILKGISFEAKPGTATALVGETGVGKTTTIELISGYYFATEGAITIDDKDITQVNLHELRERIAVVPQEVVLFNASIADNIRYGKPDATDEAVETAAKRAHADIFIDTFPKKYAQEVGERGIKLSVGQKQRVAIARAILRDPTILILDEPTSALDSKTESYITESLKDLMKGRTTFIIAHRLSTVRNADLILFMSKGQIIERGTHDELMQLENGKYRELYELHTGLPK